MICLKIHRSYRHVVALCDEDLIGKKFEEGKMQLDARENFYKDRIVTKEEAVKTMIMQSKEDATFNIIGKESINAAIEAGIIEEDEIQKIAGIPFALKLI